MSKPKPVRATLICECRDANYTKEGLECTRPANGRIVHWRNEFSWPKEIELLTFEADVPRPIEPYILLACDHHLMREREALDD